MADGKPYNPINGEDDPTPSVAAAVADAVDDDDPPDPDGENPFEAAFKDSASKSNGFEGTQIIYAGRRLTPEQQLIQEAKEKLLHTGEKQVGKQAAKSTFEKIREKFSGNSAGSEARKIAQREAAKKAEQSAAKEIGTNTAENAAKDAAKKGSKSVLKRLGKRLGLVSEEAAPAVEGAGAEGVGVAEGVAAGAAKGGLRGAVGKLGILGALAMTGWTAYKVKNEWEAGEHREAAGEVGGWAGGLAAGAAAGAATGALLGSWTGPGALVTGGIGLLVGAGFGALGMYAGKKAAQATYDAVEGPEPPHTNFARENGLQLPRGPSPNGHNYDALNRAPITFGVGDSFLCGMIQNCGGDVANYGVEGSHITTQGGKKGALEQLDEVMLHAQRGDRVFVHTGRNDLYGVNSDAYKANMERMVRELKALQDMGVDVVWVATPAGGDKDAAAVQKMADYQESVAKAHGITHFAKIEGHIPRAADGYHPQSYGPLTAAATQGTGIKLGTPNHVALSARNSSPAPAATQPNTTRIPEVMHAIGQIESSDRYHITGPVTKNGDKAYGKYQVMGNNIAKWTQEALGFSMTREQFLASPAAQDAVARHEMTKTYLQYGGDSNFEYARKQVASVWFSGQPMEGNHSQDVTGTSVPVYISRAEQVYQSGSGSQTMVAANNRAAPHRANRNTLPSGPTVQVADASPHPSLHGHVRGDDASPTT